MPIVKDVLEMACVAMVGVGYAHIQYSGNTDQLKYWLHVQFSKYTCIVGSEWKHYYLSQMCAKITS